MTLTLRARHQHDEITHIPTPPTPWPASPSRAATKARYARYRINGLHPELVALRLKMSQGDLAQMNAREREIKEAEARGRRAGR